MFGFTILLKSPTTLASRWSFEEPRGPSEWLFSWTNSYTFLSIFVIHLLFRLNIQLIWPSFNRNGEKKNFHIK
jgi:hypothetical protein